MVSDPALIKHNLSNSEAEKYRFALEKIGALCRTEQEFEADSQPKLSTVEIQKPANEDKIVGTNNNKRFFIGLNENQIEAVKSTEGFVRIIAGAGSGKTKVLVNRYAYIVETLGISTSNILCVTFTNRAAKEMKSRIQKILTREPVNDFICTFHGFCVRILREDIVLPLTIRTIFLSGL